MQCLISELEKISDDLNRVEYMPDEIENADDAVISMHMPIVMDLALNIASAFHLTISTEDLVEAGKIGLQNALESFIPVIHGAFSNHCVWYVTSAMTDACRFIEAEYMDKQNIHSYRPFSHEEM